MTPPSSMQQKPRRPAKLRTRKLSACAAGGDDCDVSSWDAALAEVEAEAERSRKRDVNTSYGGVMHEVRARSESQDDFDQHVRREHASGVARGSNEQVAQRIAEAAAAIEAGKIPDAAPGGLRRCCLCRCGACPAVPCF